ncbi:MAG TPA: hypothetical protein VGV36_03780, partial [Solirubrobacteraceae bacterium]|nr:hypothetical protein [Solirubrobacteraceae bacterium]
MTDTGTGSYSLVAVHEAGHAVAAYLHSVPLAYVNTTGTSDSGGIVTYQGRNGCAECEPIAWAIIALAGSEAAELYSDDPPEASESAEDKRLLRWNIGQIAHSQREARALEAWLRVHTRELVTTRRFLCLLDALVPELLKHGDLDGDTATGILERAEREFDFEEGGGSRFLGADPADTAPLAREETSDSVE